MTIKIELGKKRADGVCKAYVKVTAGSTKKRIPTEVYLSPTEYSITKSGLRIKNLDKKVIIDKVIQKINQEVLASDLVYGNNVTASDVASLLDKKKAVQDFFAFADDWIAHCNLKGWKNYITALNSFKAFIGKPTLSFSDITVELLIKYNRSLEGKPRAQSGYLAALRHLWNQAELMYDDVLPKSPFIKFRPPRQKKVGQRAADIDIVIKIAMYSGSVRRAILARDCFLLSVCTMGMNSADLYRCRDYKNGIISYNRAKTMDRREDNAHTEVKVLPAFEHLVRKYRSSGHNYVFNFHTHYADERNFCSALNKGLKVILGKGSKVTFYSARHTWATIGRNVLKIEKSTINDGLVHVDESMGVTDLYIKKDFTLINDANKKIVRYIDKEIKKKGGHI